MNHAAHQLPVHCICRVCVYDYACYNISWVCLGVSYLISLWVMTHMCFDSDTGVERVLYGVSNIRLYTHHLRVKPYRVRPLRYSVFSISRDWSRSGIKSCNPNNQIWDLSRNKYRFFLKDAQFDGSTQYPYLLSSEYPLNLVLAGGECMIQRGR